MSRIEVAIGDELGPGQLRLEELPSADAKAREDREAEHDDAHPAEPLRELAPQSAIV